MLVQAASPAMMVEPATASPEPSKTAETASSTPFDASAFLDGDDEDEALQAILLASLQESQQAPEVSRAASEEQISRFNAVVKPDLVGKPTPLGVYAREPSNSFSESVAASLEALAASPHYLMISHVRGDGHCLFRVVGAALILGAAWGGRQAIEALTDHLRSELLHSSAREVARLVTELLAVPSDGLLAALNDESEAGLPAQLVAALRRCAVDYMSVHSERFRHCGGQVDGSAGRSRANGTDGEAPVGSGVVGKESVEVDEAATLEANWRAYCESMADSSQARYGGHPELVALSESLRIRVDVHDTGAASGGNMATYRLGEGLPEGCPVVRGLRRGLHYNLLLCATAEGEVVME